MMPSSLVASHFGHQARGSPPVPSDSQSMTVSEVKGQAVPQRQRDKRTGFRLLQASQEDKFDPAFEASYSGVSQTNTNNAGGRFKQPVYSAAASQSRGKGTMSKFFKMHEIKYTPIQESQGQMIRCIPDGSQPAQLARKADKMRIQREKLIKRHMEMLNRQHKLIRDYRVGDLPDIQINHKDILMPLMALVRRDSTIASEVFVELFTQIYNETRSEEQKELLGTGVKDILAQSIKFDYGAISCMHKVAIELLKADQFTVDADVIARTGKHSMSFQTSLNLLEESILHGSHSKPSESQGAAAVSQSQLSQLQAKTTFGRIDASTKAYWFSLVDMYEIIGNQDALYGIRSAMGDSECILVQKDADGEASGQGKNMRRRRIQSSNQSAAASSQGGTSEDDYTRTVNLIKQVQSMRAKGSISKGLKTLEDTLKSMDAQEGCFEEQVKQDLQNKRLESLSDLLKWDVIARESLQHHSTKQLCDIPFQQAQIMIRAMLRNTSYWTNLNELIQNWNSDVRSKAYLEQQFNFEQALLQVTAKDFDRARFFINKEANDLIQQWQDMTKLSQIAQHMLVNKIQKVYEMKEFLLTCKEVSIQGKDEVIPKVFSQFKNWIQRQPSYSFDKLAVWDDILTARMLYLDCYQMIFKRDTFESHVKQLKSSEGRDEIRDIGAILYAQCAKGAYKMGMFDSSDRYLKACLDVRNKSSDIDGARSNIRIVLPIVKLKTEQFRQDTLNLSQSKKLAQLETIMSVLTNKLSAVRDQGQVLNADISAKASLLQQKLQSKLIKLVISDLVTGSSEKTPVQKQQDEQAHRKLKDFIVNAFNSLNSNYHSSNAIISDAEESKSAHHNASQAISASAILFKAKFGYRFAKLTDKLLRMMEQHEDVRDQLSSTLRHVGMNSDRLASTTVKLTFQSINMGYLKASDAIPRLLDVVSKTRSNSAKQVLKDEFIQESKDTPAWIFLRWISQLIAVINTSESEMIAHKVIQIVKSYPQALYYPWKVVESNIEVNLLSSEVETTRLYDVVKQYFEQRHENLNTWTEALNCLVDPEHRARYWMQLIYDVYKEKRQDGQPRIAILLEKMIADVATSSKPLLDSQIGEQNKLFVKQFEQYFRKKPLQKQQMDQLIPQLQRFDEEIKNSKLKPGFHKLSLFSEYLDMLDNNDFYNTNVYIEIPGQFDKGQCQVLSEPIPSKNVKIASIKKELLILGSIKRPKRITVHGSNEKDYHLLIKGGEDLRLDQRVQQLFSIMNKIFKEDPTCLNREIYLKTFSVTPMTNRLGSLEWVDNTEPLKALINREHARLENGRQLHESRAQSSLMKWLRNLPVNKSENAQKSIMQQVVNLLNLDGEEVTDGFNRHKGLMRWNLLRNGLENLCLTSAAFITIKNQFIKSLATFSIASYLIGVGDRHLENFLVDTTDGEVFGIDFGIAFGSGVQLAMPELMPFRLTQQIEGVIAPHPLEGAYKQTMVHAMGALRKRKSLILDTCEIFVKEPLLDWVKEAKKLQHAQHGDSQMSEVAGDYEEAMEQLAFYPKKKIEVVKSKLSGTHPSKILARELRDSKHYGKPYFKRLLYTIQGPKGSTRETLVSAQKQHLEITEQVDCLIEAARDPQILGRAWIGWGAYI